MSTHTELFESHSLPVTEFNPVPAADSFLWPAIIVGLILFLLTIIVVSRRRLFGLIVRSLYSQRFYSKLEHEGKVMGNPFYILIMLFDIMTFAFGIEMFMVHFELKVVSYLHYMALYGIIVVAMFFLSSFKYAFNNLHAYLFDIKNGADPLNLYKLIFVTNLAIVLFPILIIAQFSGFFVVIYAYIPFFVVLFLIYAYKLVLVTQNDINLFQYFIYFCTLEILPYLLIVKLLVKS